MARILGYREFGWNQEDYDKAKKNRERIAHPSTPEVQFWLWYERHVEDNKIVELLDDGMSLGSLPGTSRNEARKEGKEIETLELDLE